MSGAPSIPLQPVAPSNGSALGASQQSPTPLPPVHPRPQLPQTGAAGNASKKSFWDRLGGIYGIVVSVLATALTIVTFVPPFRLAKWTSQKDYIELCLTLNQTRGKMPDGCHTALNRGLSPPPYFQVLKRRVIEFLGQGSLQMPHDGSFNPDVSTGAGLPLLLILFVCSALYTIAQIFIRICLRWRRGRRQEAFVMVRRPAMQSSGEASGWIQHAEHVGHDWPSGLRRRVGANIISTDIPKFSDIDPNQYPFHDDATLDSVPPSRIEERPVQDSDDEDYRLKDDSANPWLTRKEKLLATHRRQRKELQGMIAQKKKNATKKTRKGVNDECDGLEFYLSVKQLAEIDAVISIRVQSDFVTLDNNVEESHLVGASTDEQQKKEERFDQKAKEYPESTPPAQNRKLKKPNGRKASLARRSATLSTFDDQNSNIISDNDQHLTNKQTTIDTWVQPMDKGTTSPSGYLSDDLLQPPPYSVKAPEDSQPVRNQKPHRSNKKDSKDEEGDTGKVDSKGRDINRPVLTPGPNSPNIKPRHEPSGIQRDVFEPPSPKEKVSLYRDIYEGSLSSIKKAMGLQKTKRVDKLF